MKRAREFPALCHRLRAAICVYLAAFLISPALLASEVQELTLAYPESVGMSSERLLVLDQVLRDAIRNREAPGAVAIVSRKGRVVYRKAFGNRALTPQVEPMTLDTIFDMASLTKVMATATATMILVERGQVALSDRVADYIPEFDSLDKGSITLRQLITHFSGLRPSLDLGTDWSGYEKAIELGTLERPTAPPDARFVYSDINFQLLSEVIRRVAGQTIDEFSRQEIFEPLGMRRTAFKPPEDWIERVAPADRRDGVLLRGQVHDPTAARMGGVAGHAGLFSTVDDTARWAQMILNRGRYEDGRILSPLGVLQMTTRQSPLGNHDWRGIGFDIFTRFSTNRGDLFPVGSFGHTGYTGTSVWIDPCTETFVILLTNRLHPDGRGNVVSLRRKVASAAAAAIIDLEVDREYAFCRQLQ